uniref:Uncharacterized protein n=1 Tax=Spodoptera frugiperda nuclear polyhedrosis virus TaxID=10455 RepID=A0A0R5RHJ8_NPVSF|nr:hypothetical protein [Spodoptera frugiperda multiple nucleopolyhedrovirus]
MESIFYSVDYASIIVYDSNYCSVYRYAISNQHFCTTKKYTTIFILKRRGYGLIYKASATMSISSSWLNILNALTNVCEYLPQYYFTTSIMYANEHINSSVEQLRGFVDDELLDELGFNFEQQQQQRQAKEEQDGGDDIQTTNDDADSICELTNELDNLLCEDENEEVTVNSNNFDSNPPLIDYSADSDIKKTMRSIHTTFGILAELDKLRSIINVKLANFKDNNVSNDTTNNDNTNVSNTLDEKIANYEPSEETYEPSSSEFLDSESKFRPEEMKDIIINYIHLYLLKHHKTNSVSDSVTKTLKEDLRIWMLLGIQLLSNVADVELYNVATKQWADIFKELTDAVETLTIDSKEFYTTKRLRNVIGDIFFFDNLYNNGACKFHENVSEIFEYIDKCFAPVDDDIVSRLVNDDILSQLQTMNNLASECCVSVTPFKAEDVSNDDNMPSLFSESRVKSTRKLSHKFKPRRNSKKARRALKFEQMYI